MKREIYIPLSKIKELRKDTGAYVMRSAYTKDRVCFHYELSKKGKKEISRYHLFDNNTLKHLESYDTTRYYNNGSMAGFSCSIEDTSRTKQNEVKVHNDTDKKIFKLVKEYQTI